MGARASDEGADFCDFRGRVARSAIAVSGFGV
jgi:hypothetical protein